MGGGIIKINFSKSGKKAKLKSNSMISRRTERKYDKEDMYTA